MAYRTFYRLNVWDQGFEYFWAAIAPDNTDVEEAVDWCLSQENRRLARVILLPVRDRLIVFARTAPTDVGDEFGRRVPAAIVGCVIDNPAMNSASVVGATLKCANWHGFVAKTPDLFVKIATDPVSAAAAGSQFIAQVDSELDSMINAELLLFREPPQNEARARQTRSGGALPPTQAAPKALRDEGARPAAPVATTSNIAWLALILASAACAGVLLLLLR